MVWFSRSLGRRADEVAALAETLAQSQERLLATVTGIGDGVIVTDDDCRVEMMNPVAAQLTGWTVAEALGKPLDEVFHIVSEETRQLTESPAARVLREGCVVGLANHTALIARDGSERPIADSGAPIRGKDGQITGVVLVFRDGTEERRFTAELVESERRYRQLFGEMLDGFALHEMVYDVDGAPVDYRFLAVNRVFERLTGLSEQDIIGKTVRTVIPGIEQEWIERYGAVVRSGLPTHFEMTSATMRRTYDVTAFRPAAGQFACIFNDTTERRELAAKLQVADRLMSVGTLAAGVAHEINNPLAYAAANIDFVAKELSDLLDPNPAAPTASAPSAERAREVLSALADAREGAQRVGRIVRDLKTFSRADDTESAQTDLANVLDLSLRLAGNQIHRRAKIVRAFDALPLVRASESRLGQVFVNLLVNAAQAIGDGDPENNEIRVSTSFVTEGQVAVEVWDSGCGMPPEVIEHIFDPFFTTKPVGEGTGLGLSICHGIVVDLGGQIQVSSTPGRGTVMRVLLPVAQAPDAEPPAQKPEPTAPSSRILVIDDQAAVAKALKRLIGGTHDVHVFTDAREALRQVQNGERYDIILTDLMMPEMSGMDLYRELARSHPEQAARMAFITGDAFTPEARAFLEQFPTRHLEKPFDQRAIRELIQAMLQEPI
jgi:PAS domain S-box-containing protein